MKKRVPLVICLLICLMLPAGCACKHTWGEAGCETAKTCPDCGETEGEPLGHSWIDAACETAKTCSVCGETEGEPLGHSWIDATCETPRTCSVCAATEGQPSAHSEALRESAIDYINLKRERQTYCTDCGRVLSSEEITLAALHDGTHFLFDSRTFWERYAAIDGQFSYTYLNDVADEVTEETRQDTLTLECSDQYGYALKVHFHFEDLVEADGEYALPRCARIIVDPAVSGELGDPDPDGLLDGAMTSEDKEYADEIRDKTNTVAINLLMFRNLMVAFMTADPTLDPVNIYGSDGVMVLVLGALDILDGKNPQMSGDLQPVQGEYPGFILNGIYYYANEDGNLVIEAAP